MEGIVTVFVGIFVPLLLPDTPVVPCKWLNAEERKYLELRLAAQDGGLKVQAARKRFSMKTFLSVLKDGSSTPSPPCTGRMPFQATV